jgi:hypothetical protein
MEPRRTRISIWLLLRPTGALCNAKGGAEQETQGSRQARDQIDRRLSFFSGRKVKLQCESRESACRSLRCFRESAGGRRRRAATVPQASFPSFAEKRQISVDGGEWPTWRKDGREVFFRKSDGTVMSAEIQTEGKIEASVPKRLFKYSTNPFTETYSPTGDGKRFLVLESEEKGPVGQMMVVMNWTAALKRP